MNDLPNLSFTDFWYAQAAWSNKVFGTELERGPLGPARHLLKEVQEELIPAIESGAESSVVHEEVIDCLFLIVDTARRAKLDPFTLIERAFEKLEVNRQREWQKPTSDEPVEHV